jgi:hypothetical protein
MRQTLQPVACHDNFFCRSETATNYAPFGISPMSSQDPSETADVIQSLLVLHHSEHDSSK